MNIAALATRFWHREFKRRLSLKHFEFAEMSWRNYQAWKRRAKIEDMLTEICERKNFGGVYDR